MCVKKYIVACLYKNELLFQFCNLCTRIIKTVSLFTPTPAPVNTVFICLLWQSLSEPLSPDFLGGTDKRTYQGRRDTGERKDYRRGSGDSCLFLMERRMPRANIRQKSPWPLRRQSPDRGEELLFEVPQTVPTPALWSPLPSEHVLMSLEMVVLAGLEAVAKG